MKEFDYIVIGSGFGGSVSSLRLVEKGYKVAILEQGQYFKDSDYPKTNWNIKKYLWAPLIKCFGFQKITWFKNVLILSGTGVGGGSLVYANTHMGPPDTFFKNSVWAHLKNSKETLMPFYSIAKTMLGTTKNPWSHKGDRLLAEVAQDMNKLNSVENVDVGVYFGDTNNMVDPYFNGHGPLRSGCTGCAGCMVGCRYNAKNTLVKNYLHFALKYGASLFSKTKVEKIEYKNNKYYIHTFQTGSWLKAKKNVFVSKGLIVSGGVLGSMDLLLKQKYIYKTLPNLSDKLGGNIRTNSEMLCGVTSENTKLNEGVAISSVMNPDEDTHVEIVKYSTGSSFMKLLTLPYVRFAKVPRRFLLSIFEIIKSPFKYAKLYFSPGWSDKTIIFLVMQHLDSSLKMKISKWPFRYLSLKADSKEKVPAFIKGGTEVLERYSEKVGGTPQSSFIEILADKPATAHILGGAPMASTIQNGVVNERFEVFNYPNMHILDGSIIPCNLGVNPSLTITALSEYAMSFIPSANNGKDFNLSEILKNPATH